MIHFFVFVFFFFLGGGSCFFFGSNYPPLFFFFNFLGPTSSFVFWGVGGRGFLFWKTPQEGHFVQFYTALAFLPPKILRLFFFFFFLLFFVFFYFFCFFFLPFQKSIFACLLFLYQPLFKTLFCHYYLCFFFHFLSWCLPLCFKQTSQTSPFEPQVAIIIMLFCSSFVSLLLVLLSEKKNFLVQVKDCN